MLPPISPEDHQIQHAARAQLARLTKPIGSLGRLEPLAVRLCAMSGTVPPPVPDRPALAVFAGDHGVVAEGVTPWPSEVTAQMVANFAGGGAAVNVLTRLFGIELVVVDVGVLLDVSAVPGVLQRKVRAGTRNLAVEPAMTSDEASAAAQVGMDVAQDLVARGHNLLATGEMGIGNTTAAATIVCALTSTDPSVGVGRGTGIDDVTHARKVAVVRTALARFAAGGPNDDAWRVLTELGGLEIAALVGFIIGGAASGVPVVVDGVITLAAALIADSLAPNLRHYLIAGHRSPEPSASVVLDALDLDPVLELDMRLGEGTGAAMAIPAVQAAAALIGQMATFDAAGVADRT